MKKIVTIFILVSQATCIWAQGTVKGRLLDEKKEGMPFANILVLNPKDSSTVKFGVSNLEGKFEIYGVPAGNYVISVSMVGYQKFISSSFQLNENGTQDFGEILMIEDAKTLSEVVVTAQKPLVEMQPDKTVVNVAASPTSVGKDAMEMLQKSPGVVVDKDDNIILQGKNGVLIYIDGKPSPLAASDLATYLRSLQATDIETIEIITNPSSKYDAAGNAGIINIKLKKNENFGTNGSATVTYSQGINERYNASVNINNRTKNTNTFANVSALKGTWWSRQTFDREIGTTNFSQNAIQDWDNQGVNFKTGLDYYLSDKATLGGVVNGNIFDGGMQAISKTFIREDSENEPNSILNAQSISDRNRFNLSGNLNYRYDNKKGKEFSSDIDYAVFRNVNEMYQPNFYVNPETGTLIDERIYQNNTHTDISIFTVKSDYSRPLLGGKFSTGFKVSYVKTNNDFDFYNVINGEDVLDPQRTNRFIYTENVNAAYVNFQKQNKSWNYQFGLRAEHTNSEGDLDSTVPTNNKNVSRNYLNLFPSAGITYTMNQKNSFGLKYSRRIDRPNYQFLNPFEYRLDEITYMKGNPFLKPQYTHSFELTHTYNNFLNTAVNYSMTTDMFAQIVERDTTASGSNKAALIQNNVADNRTLSLTLSVPMPISKWWSTYTSFNGFRSWYKADLGTDRKIDLTVDAFNVYQQHTFSLPKDIKLELTANYNSPNIWGGVFKMKRQWGIDLGVQKKIMKGAGTVRATVTDIFRTMPWRGVSNFGGVYLKANGAWESQQIRVSFSYNFGNQKMKVGRQRTTGAQDETRRLDSGN
ncbi:MAG: outer membrane beta-barrel family protein [Flammeovirgaceae bacterium]